MPKRTRNLKAPAPRSPAVSGIGFVELDFPAVLRPRAVVELEGGLRILLESLDDVALAAALIKSLGTAKPGKGGRSC